MSERERAISGEVFINANLAEAWNAWTTKKGIASFFAPDCKIDIKPGGYYEIYFDPEAPEGERGGEGLKVLAVQPEKMLSFTWNAPPSLPEVRHQHTSVVLRFYSIEDGTKVTLYHSGWGSGGQWDQAFEYFQRAWLAIVLPRLAYRFKKGAIDWSNPPGINELADYNN